MAQSFLIVLPVRNGGQHLRECVASILAQTYENFRLVVLDNASTDGTTAWLRSQSDPRVCVVESGADLAIEANWARIVRVPSEAGEFMTLIGHDDVLDSGFLATMCELIRAEPQASLYQTHFRLIDAAGTRTRSCMPMPYHEGAHGFLSARLSFRRDSFGTGYVFRAADYAGVGGIPEYPKLLFADDALWLMLMQGGRKVTHPQQCFSYRVHAASASYAPDWNPLFAALTRYLDLLTGLAQSDARIALVLQEGLSAYALYLFRLAYFAAGGRGGDRGALESAISVLLPQVKALLSRREAQRFEGVMRRGLCGTLARPRWLAWRAQTWLSRRWAAATG